MEVINIKRMFMFAILFILTISLISCTGKPVIEYANAYEDDGYINATTNEEKAEIINNKFMGAVFSIDKNKKNDTNAMEIINLYSLENFYTKFQNAIYPDLSKINKRSVISCETLGAVPGFIKLNNNDTDAIIVTSKVTYIQNVSKITKYYDILFVNDNGQIKVSDMAEINGDTITDESVLGTFDDSRAIMKEKQNQ